MLLRATSIGVDATVTPLHPPGDSEAEGRQQRARARPGIDPERCFARPSSSGRPLAQTRPSGRLQTRTARSRRPPLATQQSATRRDPLLSSPRGSGPTASGGTAGGPPKQPRREHDCFRRQAAALAAQHAVAREPADCSRASPPLPMQIGDCARGCASPALGETGSSRSACVWANAAVSIGLH